MSFELTHLQEQPLPHLRHRHRQMFVIPVPGLWPSGQEFEEV